VNQQTVDDLLNISALVREGWTQSCSARNAYGEATAAADPQACCWCLTGALARAIPYGPAVENIERRLAATKALNTALRTRPRWTIADSSIEDRSHLEVWNDQRERTQAEVVELVEQAIKLELAS
jgi:hypothetical protein